LNPKNIAKRGQQLSNNGLFVSTTAWNFPYSLIEDLLARYAQPQSFAPFSMAIVATDLAHNSRNSNVNVKGNEYG